MKKLAVAASLVAAFGVAQPTRPWVGGVGKESIAFAPAATSAATGGQDAVINYLLAEGANINAVSPNGTSALMMAVREGKGPTVTLLIAKGANVNVRNQDDATALAWALRGNEQAMAAALRRAGAKE